MSNKKIKEMLSDLEHLLVSQQNDINRNRYNSKFKDSLIEQMQIKINRREERISELLGYIEELENKLLNK